MNQKVNQGRNAPAAPKPAAESGSRAAIKVISRPAQFRRAGLVFTSEPRTIPLADLTEEQLEALRAETNLVVVDVELPAEVVDGEKK